MDVDCPECNHGFDVWDHHNWDEDSFEVECPSCGAPLVIKVDQEVTYTYTAVVDDDRLIETEKTSEEPRA